MPIRPQPQPEYQDQINAAIQSVIHSNTFLGGREVNLLEEELSEFLQVPYCLACGSGTDAILLALMALDIQPGDEVICPAYSYAAPAAMVELLKGNPVFVDVSPVDYTIDARKIEEKITSRTKAIIAVSLFGQCANFYPINELARQHEIWVIEDGSDSFGARYFGEYSGTLAHLSTTSFGPSMSLSGYGRGGAVFTRHKQLAEKIKLLRNHGLNAFGQYQFIGLNSRMDNIQAAVVRIKLQHLHHEMHIRERNAKLYQKLLPSNTLLPEIANGRESAWSSYTIGTPDRSRLEEELRKQEIPGPLHRPANLAGQPAFINNRFPDESFKVADLLHSTAVSLPIHSQFSNLSIKKIATLTSQCLTGH